MRGNRREQGRRRRGWSLALGSLPLLLASGACGGSATIRPADGASLLSPSGTDEPVAEGEGVLGEWVFSGGIRRTYSLHLPPGHDASRPAPVVLVFHGAGGNRSVAQDSGMIAAADRHGFITVSPHGVGNSWALFCGGCTVADQAGVDDVGFVARLINHLGEHLSIDRGRIFAAGISDGGSFTNRLACQYPLAGAAVLAGTMFFPPALCQPTTDVSVIGFHGTDDSLIHISAGYGPIQMWARLGGCDDEPVVTPLPDLEPADRTTVERYDFTGCESGTAVVFYSIVNGGHNWPGTGGGLGLPNFDVNASEEIMDFFSTRSVTP